MVVVERSEHNLSSFLTIIVCEGEAPVEDVVSHGSRSLGFRLKY